jgi:hypothetical protein
MSDSLLEPNAQPERGGDGAIHQVSFMLDFRYYQALRDAKRKLNPIDDFIWRWRYALAFAIAGITVFWLVIRGGFTPAEMLSWEFLLSLGGLGLALPLLIFLIDLLFDQVLARWIFRRSSMAGQMLTIDLNDQRIAWWAEGIRGELDWTRILRIVALKDYLFFFFGKMEAIGLPRNAAPQGAFDRIVSFAKERANGQAL